MTKLLVPPVCNENLDNTELRSNIEKILTLFKYDPCLFCFYLRNITRNFETVSSKQISDSELAFQYTWIYVDIVKSRDYFRLPMLSTNQTLTLCIRYIKWRINSISRKGKSFILYICTVPDRASSTFFFKDNLYFWMSYLKAHVIGTQGVKSFVILCKVFVEKINVISKLPYFIALSKIYRKFLQPFSVYDHFWIGDRNMNEKVQLEVLLAMKAIPHNSLRRIRQKQDTIAYDNFKKWNSVKRSIEDTFTRTETLIGETKKNPKWMRELHTYIQGISNSFRIMWYLISSSNFLVQIILL